MKISPLFSKHSLGIQTDEEVSFHNALMPPPPKSNLLAFLYLCITCLACSKLAIKQQELALKLLSCDLPWFCNTSQKDSSYGSTCPNICAYMYFHAVAIVHVLSRIIPGRKCTQGNDTNSSDYKYQCSGQLPAFTFVDGAIIAAQGQENVMR